MTNVRDPGESVGRFILRTLGWLPVCFAAWYLAARVVVWPASMLASAVARIGFGDLFAAVEQGAPAVTFVTRLRPEGAAAAPNAVVAFDVNALIYTFGVPMVAALTLAARQAPVWKRLLGCFVVLIPFQAWGIVADAVQTVALSMGPGIAAQTGFSAAQREVIAFAYQFGHLVLPAVAPAVAWVAFHRDFLQRFVGSAR